MKYSLLKYYMKIYSDIAFTYLNVPISYLLFSSIISFLSFLCLSYFYTTRGFIFNLVNYFFNIIKSLAIQNIGNKHYAYILFFFFIMICITNTLRCFLIFPINSIIFFPGLYASIIFLYALYFGIKQNGLMFLWNLVPTNIPILIKPILILIELTVFIIKPIALCARLFLNIFVGNIVIHSIYEVIQSFGNIGYIALPILIILNIMEIIIGLLQAYIFTLFASFLIATALSSH